MKKKILALLLACIMLLGLLAGCKKDSSADNQTDNSGSSTNQGGKSGGKDAADNSGFVQPVYAYVPEYHSLDTNGVNMEWVQRVAVSGENVFILAEVITATETITEEYEGETNTYYNNTYETQLFRMNVDGTGFQQMEGYKPHQFEEGEEGYANVDNMSVADDGTIWILERDSVTIYDLPDDWDESVDGGGDVVVYNDDVAAEEDTPITAEPVANGRDKWDYYEGEKSSLRMVHLAADGSMIGESNFEFPEDQNIYNMLMDKEGNLIGFNDETIFLFDKDGNQTGTIDLTESGTINGGELQMMGDQVCLMAYGEDGRTIYSVDLENKALGDPMEVNSRAYQFYPGFDKYEYLYQYNESIYGHVKDTEIDQDEKVLNWLDADVDSNGINSFSFLPDGKVVAFSQTWDQQTQKQNNQLIIMNRVDRSTLPEKVELSLACMYLDWDVRQRILNFNRSHDDIRISVRDYSEFNTDEDYSAGMTKLNAEILAGNVPDLLMMNNLPVSRYASKGLVEDLWPYIDNDPELSREELMTEVFDAMAINGKLYQITNVFGIQTLIGNKNLVGDRFSWTVADLEQAMNEMPDGATVFGQYNTKDNVLSTCIARNLESFVDWSTGKCNFDSQEFIDLLKFTDRFPKEFNWDQYDYSEWESDVTRIRSGKQMLMEYYFSSFDDYQYAMVPFGGDAVCIGYPTTADCGSNFTINTSYGMSSTCKDKEAAWSFLREMLLYENQYSEYMWQFPTNRRAFEAMQEKSMANETWQNPETGEEEIQPKTTYWVSDEEQIEIYAMTQEQMDEFMNFYHSIKTVSSYDTEIFSIVSDQAQAYFDGQRSAEETARLIQSRVSLYVAEQR